MLLITVGRDCSAANIQYVVYIQQYIQLRSYTNDIPCNNKYHVWSCDWSCDSITYYDKLKKNVF